MISGSSDMASVVCARRALDRYPRGVTGHVARPMSSIVSRHLPPHWTTALAALRPCRSSRFAPFRFLIAKRFSPRNTERGQEQGGVRPIFSFFSFRALGDLSGE